MNSEILNQYIFYEFNLKILRNRETSNTDDKILLLTIKCIDIKERKEKNLSAIHPLPEFPSRTEYIDMKRKKSICDP